MIMITDIFFKINKGDHFKTVGREKMKDPRLKNPETKKAMIEYNGLLERSVKALEYFEDLKDRYGLNFEQTNTFKQAHVKFLWINERMETLLEKIGCYRVDNEVNEVLEGFKI